MSDERFSMKNVSKDVIKGRFESMDYICVRCGNPNIEKHHSEFLAQGHEFHNATPSKIDHTLVVTGQLSCKNCNHQFEIKIIDQGMMN